MLITDSWLFHSLFIMLVYSNVLLDRLFLDNNLIAYSVKTTLTCYVLKTQPPLPPKGDKKYMKKLRKSPSGGFRGGAVTQCYSVNCFA